MQVGCRDDRAAPAGDGHTPAGVHPTHLGRPPSSTYPCPSEYPLVRCGTPRTPPASQVKSVSRRFLPQAVRPFVRAARPAAGYCRRRIGPIVASVARRAVVVSIAAPLRAAALEYNAIPRRSALCRSSAPRWYTSRRFPGRTCSCATRRRATPSCAHHSCTALQRSRAWWQRSAARPQRHEQSHCTALRDASSSRAFLCASACHEARHGRRAPRALRVRPARFRARSR